VTLRATVVVPIYNRAAELQQVVAALETQTIPHSEWQLLICDDGSDEDLAASVSQSPLDIKWLRQNRGGPAAARNLGLFTASTPIIAFTDSDCIPEAQWLESLISPIENDTADVTGGFVGFDSAEQWVGRCLNFVMTTGLGAAGARDPRAMLGMKFHPRTGNMAVKLDIARRAGGFPNERYGEDVEFGRRLMAQEARIEFVPSAVVVHNEKRTIRQVGIEAYRKGAARIRLTQRYGFKELIHAAPAGLLLYVLLLPLMLVLFPSLAMLSAAPLAVYALALSALAVQGTRRLRDVRAMVTVPLITVVLHMGYGLGYCAAGIRNLLRIGAAASRKRVLQPQLAHLEDPAPLAVGAALQTSVDGQSLT